MFLRENLRLLRKRKHRTQDDVASFLGMKRSTYSGYENGISDPGVAELKAFSEYFSISMDTLVKIDLAALSESQLRELIEGFDQYVKGANLRILSTTVDQDNNENIELVNERAKAGYRRGYADPEYIRELPVFQLPFLSPERKYRTFQISGESMLPIPDKAFVTGEFVENWEYLKNGDPCIVLTKDDGLVFKLIEKDFRQKQFKLHSLNREFESFNLPVEEIAEIWKFVHYISSEMPDPLSVEQELYHVVANLKDEVAELRRRMADDG